ncbi:methyltransferase domain-containing protein [Kitasatospora sp. RB6PN24]|uniref:class I SAM-dependent methyltransferase n=1 Tax=Kitasatospora humi TaxID=2893891 RepID=UPI001E2DF8C1|nr:class I SAM-dependent methyltransferase [Kitasatospora humi]MCC9310578.1 methyltransferase domain-containing protein [Kitasatospora humi]
MSTKTLLVDPSNAEQARAWDGDEGSFWAANAAQFDAAVGGHHTRFLDTAAIGPAERVLDIGCGTGRTTLDAARRAVDGAALGVDLSAKMLTVARRTAAHEGVRNVHFTQADAQIHDFGAEPFDAAISRTGTMFFADPAAAFRNTARALRPGGRLVQLVWQAPSHNPWFTELTSALAAGRTLPAPPPDAPGPFSLADPDRVRALLTTAGFDEPTFEAVSAPMHFGPDADQAHRFVTGLLGWMLTDLDDADRNRALADLRTTIDAHATRSGVLFDSGTWLITARRQDTTG